MLRQGRHGHRLRRRLRAAPQRRIDGLLPPPPTMPEKKPSLPGVRGIAGADGRRLAEPLTPSPSSRRTDVHSAPRHPVPISLSRRSSSNNRCCCRALAAVAGSSVRERRRLDGIDIEEMEQLNDEMKGHLDPDRESQLHDAT